MRIAALVFLAVPAALFAGCPGSGTTPAGSADCIGYYDALNAVSVRCGLGEISHNRDAALRECTINASLPGTAYGGFFSTCVNALNTAGCDAINTISETGGPCATPPGTLTTGAGCTSSLQCASKACTEKGMTTGKPAYCGKCGTSVAAGGACSIGSSGVSCESGSRCQTNADAGSSLEGVCTITVRAGEGETCSGSSSCVSGLDCKSNKCTTRAKLGEDCTSKNCTSGTYCTATPGGSAGTCAALPKAGDPCAAQDKCPSGLYCTSGKCQPLTYAGSGEACDSKGLRCNEGSCITSTGISDAGAPVATTGKCPNVLAEGAPCTENTPNEVCPEPTECYDGKCQVVDGTKCL